MNTIYIKEVCGAEVLSRSNVRKLYNIISTDTKAIDLTGVTFISRSVADELCNILSEYTSLEFTGIHKDVETMLEIVRKGRATKRELATKSKVSMTFNCKTMEDLRKALLSFGL